MRKLIATTFITVDGVVEEPDWTAQFRNEDFWSDDAVQFKREELMATDALLLGRVTYEGFVKARPGRTDEVGFADRMNSLPKYVVSTTLTDVTWNATVIRDDVAAAVARLKETPGGDIAIHGSATLINSLLPTGLIDEYRLMVHPLILGGGARLFTEHTEPIALALTGTITFSSGVMVLTYAPRTATGAV